MGNGRSMEKLFAVRHFDREVIILCVRRYLRHKLSFQDLVQMMAERGLSLAHTTILRWVRQTIDFRLNRTRDVAAAKAFFQKAVRHEGRPQQIITLDGMPRRIEPFRNCETMGSCPSGRSGGLPSI